MQEQDSQTASVIRHTDPYGFRSGEWARILTTIESYGRPCYLVQFEDGQEDWWPVANDHASYEFR